MQIPIIHRLEIVAGPTPGTLLGIPRVIAPDGTILDSGESVPLVAGQSLLYGPITVQVSSEATWQTGATPGAPGVTPAATAPARSSAPPAAGRGRY